MGPATDLEKKEMEKVPCRAMTGSLNFFRMTRPDMAVATSVNSQVNNCYGKQNVAAAEHELRYAGGSKDWGVGFAKTKPGRPQVWVIKVWVDSSHVICPKTRRSRTGFFVTLNGNLISYKCKLQPGVPSQSSSEAEYRALSDALNEVIWIVMVLREIGIQVQTPIEFMEDNQATIKLGQNKMASARSKHIELRHHVIRYHNEKGTICLSYVSTNKMITDMLTKCLTRPNFERLRSQVMTDAKIDVNDDRFVSKH